ncbi:hypothetical protein HBI56_069620 [Parastagonospora nodorum]|nr:hypothetical protein HBH52_105950 [Parastagonospora nodorum]KAH4105432.1 hypothetical protein HBH46_081190 [Parastagonospora nodorum]KAH4122386.1 hypothetical protein HBH47_089670 [Parastagonospora nodorum]KAH4179354.1 hypothetical protein HBH43_016230 [Parastagonospora nodorum]KAH5039687.1 hypothetical protein HBI75_060430 [Parastagonospora nodorum]
MAPTSPVMQPTLPSVRSSRKDRTSINIGPDQSIDTEPILSCLPCLLGEDTECCYSSRLEDVQGQQPHASLTKVETAIMGEVADWWQSEYVDEFWAPRNKQQRRMPPTANQILLQARNSKMLSGGLPIGAGTFEILLHAIALQLLASCYTRLPATASNLPLFQQRTCPMQITALRLHMRYRFEPAAGHHARASSETAAWPGLYTGPTVEDNLAEMATLRRRQRHSSGRVPCFAASGWTDGSSSPGEDHGRETSSSSAESNSSSQPGFFSRLICQPSIPKNPRRKYNTLFTSLTTRRGKPAGTLRTRSSSSKVHHNRPKALRAFTEHTVQRIPSMLRLRQTQSAPRFEADEASPTIGLHESRRHSSNPSIGSALNYPCEIPQIRRISATLAASQYDRKMSYAVRFCGRGDLLKEDEYLDPSETTSPLSSISTVLNSDDTPRNVLRPPELDPKALSPRAVSPRTITTVPDQPDDYFASVRAATHVHDDKYDDIDSEDRLLEEREAAGPNIDDSPSLQRIFARMDADSESYMSDDQSDDSDLERDRKRRSILSEPSSVSDQIVERFGFRRQDSRLTDRLTDD